MSSETGAADRSCEPREVWWSERGGQQGGRSEGEGGCVCMGDWVGPMCDVNLFLNSTYLPPLSAIEGSVCVWRGGAGRGRWNGGETGGGGAGKNPGGGAEGGLTVDKGGGAGGGGRGGGEWGAMVEMS
jgi:hypothetical protein